MRNVWVLSLGAKCVLTTGLSLLPGLFSGQSEKHIFFSLTNRIKDTLFSPFPVFYAVWSSKWNTYFYGGKIYTTWNFHFAISFLSVQVWGIKYIQVFVQLSAPIQSKLSVLKSLHVIFVFRWLCHHTTYSYTSHFHLLSTLCGWFSPFWYFFVLNYVK